MGFFDRLFGKRKPTTDDLQEYPWDQRPSIYEHVKAHVRPGKNGLADGGDKLPDDEQISSSSRIRWASGAMDGVSTHHMGGEDANQATEFLTLIQAYSTSPTAKNKAKIHDYAVKNNVVAMIDPFLESLRKQSSLNHERAYELAKSFATESSNREAVKFGIALLGLFGQRQDANIFRTLGRHEEFTLFCAVALCNCCEDGEGELWSLAKHVDGWGRIHLVERLYSTQNPEIKDWLLRDGYKNSIMYEYLAYPCAVSGGLLEALERDSVDDELRHCAAEMILALITGGPAQNMDDYEDGAIVVQLFLNQMEKPRSSLSELLTVNAIHDFLSNEEADWENRSNRGWTSEKRSVLQHQCKEIKDQPHWQTRVTQGLNSNDEQEFFNADRAASNLQIDTWPYHWKRLQEKPLNSSLWYIVMRNCNSSRIAQIVALAESVLPLNEIAVGPGLEMGLGPAFDAQSSLGFILQDLGKFPGHGVRLVETGLRCTTIRNRNMALKTLSEWGKANWPVKMQSLLKQALSREPDERVRQCIGCVLEGKPLKTDK